MCLVVSACKVSNDLDKYLQRHSIFKDCLEPDVHHTILRSFFRSLNLDNPLTRIVEKVFRTVNGNLPDFERTLTLFDMGGGMMAPQMFLTTVSKHLGGGS